MDRNRPPWRELTNPPAFHLRVRAVVCDSPVPVIPKSRIAFLAPSPVLPCHLFVPQFGSAYKFSCEDRGSMVACFSFAMITIHPADPRTPEAQKLLSAFIEEVRKRYENAPADVGEFDPELVSQPRS